MRHTKRLVTAAVAAALSVAVAVPALASTSAPTIKSGMRGSNVACVQRAVNYSGIRTSVDGIFGPQTLAAVRLFQSKRNLAVDGLVGRKTGTALMLGLDAHGEHARCYPLVPTLS